MKHKVLSLESYPLLETLHSYQIFGCINKKADLGKYCHWNTLGVPSFQSSFRNCLILVLKSCRNVSAGSILLQWTMTFQIPASTTPAFFQRRSLKRCKSWGNPKWYTRTSAYKDHSFLHHFIPESTHFSCWLLQTVYVEATTYMAPFFQTCKIIKALCFKPSRIIHRPGKTFFSFNSFHCDSAWILASSFTHISKWHLPNSDEITLKYGEDQQNNKIVFPYLVFKNTIVWYIHRTPIHIHLQTLQLPPPPPAPCIQDPWHRLQLHLPQSCHVQFGLAWRDSWMFSFKDLGNDGKISRYLYL